MFTKETLVGQIRAMGVLPTDTVMIHTSMKAIGEVEGGADTVIDAFIEALPEGLLLIPTHTWWSVWKGKENPVYDVRTEKPCIGALPTVAAFRKDGIRSLHPTHSVWAHGKNAAEFVAGEEKALTPCPPGFMWDRLADVQAKILLLGVGNDKNTFIHAIDEVADIPDRLDPVPFELTIIDHDGNAYRHPFYGHHCSKNDDVSMQFTNFEPALIEMGAQTFGKLGNAAVRIVEAAKCKEIILRIYAHADRDVCIEKMEIPREWYI